MLICNCAASASSPTLEDVPSGAGTVAGRLDASGAETGAVRLGTAGAGIGTAATAAAEDEDPNATLLGVAVESSVVAALDGEL